jgi:hypothetical protein
MESPKGPIDTIFKLLSEDLRAMILGLPKELQADVPKEVKEETGIFAADETPDENKRPPNPPESG